MTPSPAQRTIAIFYNDDGALAGGEAGDALAVTAVDDCARAVEAACRRIGFAVQRIAAHPDPERFARDATHAGADLVFNLVESLRGEARFEAAASWIFELLGLPYTGSPPRAQTLALEKPLARAVLGAAGIPIAPGAVLERGDESLAPAGPGPWIVKPAREDASHGIALESVCRTPAAARARARFVIETYRQPALVEEFVDGLELNVSLLGEGARLHALPLAQIDFSGFPADRPHVVTYEAKWVESSAEYRGSTPVPAADLDPGTERRVEEVARAAYAALGLRDYGRVDLRLHRHLGPVVIDVNPNPDISPDAGLAKAAARGGLPYDELIRSIIDSALARAHPRARTG
jgi:D-alanine-D-alanine ligase